MTTGSLSFPDVLNKMTLMNILCTALEVKRESNGPAESAKLDSSFGFGTQENQVFIKVRQDLSILGAEQTPFIVINTEFLVFYGLSDAESLLEGNEEFQSKITRYAHMAAHPYMRASITDLANQVGVPGVTLGFLRLGAELPESLAVQDKLFSFPQQGVGAG